MLLMTFPFTHTRLPVFMIAIFAYFETKLYTMVFTEYQSNDFEIIVNISSKTFDPRHRY
jgi:hypothetical protein